MSGYDGAGDALGRFAARYRELVAERGTNFTQLAKATGYSQTHVSGAAKGVVPSERLVIALDAALKAGGELLALWDQADRERTARRRNRERPRAGVDTGADGGARLSPDTRSAELARIGEADDTDRNRREFGGLTWAAILAAAGDASNSLAVADPPPLVLEEMEAAAEDVRAQIYDVPHAVMLRRAGKQWHDAHVILDRQVSGEVRSRLLLVAGSLACNAATLGRWLGDADAIRRFGSLAKQYAAESGDPLLAGRGAALRSRIAFDQGQYLKAAEVAARGRVVAHPSQRARLAAYQAEALGAAGKDSAARDALAVMHAESRAAARWTEGEQVLFEALTLKGLEDWEPAADLARLCTGADNDRQGVGLAHATLGRCELSGDRPDPAAAAYEGVEALGATVGPNTTVVRPVSALHADLRRRWQGVAEVAELGEALTAARGSLNAV